MQPTRMPAARFGAGDVVPEGVDRTREFEALQTQSRARRRLLELQTKKSGRESWQIHIAALAARPRCAVQRFPAMTANRGAHPKAARRCITEPVDNQTPQRAGLDRIDHNPR